MKKIVGLLALGALLVACSGKEENSEKDGFYQTEVPDVETLKEGIKTLEDSLYAMSTQADIAKQIPNLTRMALIEKLLLVYREYPKDQQAAECLDKVQMTYSAMEAHRACANYADTLLMKYPDYEGRMLVIESQIANYDQFIKPWDKEKVKHYYDMLLKEFPNMSEEKKADIEFRLENIDLSLEELIEKQLNAIQ